MESIPYPYNGDDIKLTTILNSNKFKEFVDQFYSEHRYINNVIVNYQDNTILYDGWIYRVELSL